jgi:hypothetical protein
MHNGRHSLQSNSHNNKLQQTVQKEWRANLSIIQSLASNLASKEEPSAQILIEKATQAVSMVQIQIDMVQEVLSNLGHLHKIKESPKAIPAYVEQVPENPFFTPRKMKETYVSEKIQHLELKSPQFENIGLSNLGMSLLGMHPTMELLNKDSPIFPVIESFQTSTSRESDIIEPLHLRSVMKPSRESLDADFNTQTSSPIFPVIQSFQTSTSRESDIIEPLQLRSVMKPSKESLDADFNTHISSPIFPVIESFQTSTSRESDIIETSLVGTRSKLIRESLDADFRHEDFNTHHTRLSDPNSLFNSLVAPITGDEYDQLPSFMKDQMTREFINMIVDGTKLLIIHRAQ